MPDITMCRSTVCPKRDYCYRFRAKASQRQSYFADQKMTYPECGHFVGIEAGDNLDPAEEKRHG